MVTFFLQKEKKTTKILIHVNLTLLNQQKKDYGFSRHYMSESKFLKVTLYIMKYCGNSQIHL